MMRPSRSALSRGGWLLAAFAVFAATPVAAATLTAFASMHDAFGTTANITDAPRPLTIGSVLFGDPLPTLSATARDAETGGGGAALAKGAQFVSSISAAYVELGVAAAARSQGNRVGTARASALIDFKITVDIILPGPSDLILGSLARICLSAGSCNLSADFLHQTSGRFSYSSFLTDDAGAQFSESLSLNDKSSAGVAAINGVQGVGGTTVTPSVNGAWRLDDFVQGVGAPGESAMTFNHFAFINGVVGDFKRVGTPLSRTMRAIYTAQLAQEAVAGFGSSDYAFGAIGADFAHTSRLSMTGIRDPLSGLDLSNLERTVTFTDLSAVPLPAPATMLAPALFGLAAFARLRRRGVTGCANEFAATAPPSRHRPARPRPSRKSTCPT